MPPLPGVQIVKLPLKSWLFTAPVLIMPDYDKPFKLVADACGFRIGAALLQ